MSKPTFLYCRPGSKLLKDEDIFETNLGSGYDYYTVYTDVAEGHLNDRNSMFLLDGTNPRQEQLIVLNTSFAELTASYWPLYQEFGYNYVASTVVNGNFGLETHRGRRINEYNIFCIGIKRDDPNDEFRVFGANAIPGISKQRYLFYTGNPNTGDSPGTSTYMWFTFFVTSGGKVVPLGSNNWY